MKFNVIQHGVDLGVNMIAFLMKLINQDMTF